MEMNIFSICVFLPCRSDTSQQSNKRPESIYEDEDEEILGSDDDEQEDPRDYGKGEGQHAKL